MCRCLVGVERCKHVYCKYTYLSVSYETREFTMCVRHLYDILRKRNESDSALRLTLAAALTSSILHNSGRAQSLSRRSSLRFVWCEFLFLVRGHQCTLRAGRTGLLHQQDTRSIFSTFEVFAMCSANVRWLFFFSLLVMMVTKMWWSMLKARCGHTKKECC